jgi:T6SS, Phospholipase effector Tle1-like, catalytic domain
MKFTDRAVNTNVEYVRHAISIDERRAAFGREPIDDPIKWPERRRVHGDWLIQLWFAGDHDDVGGSSPEPESRLSDIALAWMAGEAEKTGLIVDRRLLQLYPAANGMQHDQFKSSLFKHFGQRDRDPDRESPLHPTVIRRFEEPSVLHYDIWRRYRPRCLRHNIFVSHFWDADDLQERYKNSAHDEALRRRAEASRQDPSASSDGPYWQRVADEIARRRAVRAAVP